MYIALQSLFSLVFSCFPSLLSFQLFKHCPLQTSRTRPLGLVPRFQTTRRYTLATSHQYINSTPQYHGKAISIKNLPLNANYSSCVSLTSSLLLVSPTATLFPLSLSPLQPTTTTPPPPPQSTPSSPPQRFTTPTRPLLLSRAPPRPPPLRNHPPSLAALLRSRCRALWPLSWLSLPQVSWPCNGFITGFDGMQEVMDGCPGHTRSRARTAVCKSMRTWSHVH
ncbi:hypothetical protein B0J13DRAFT_544721, partial [Dactylonectria estremocensis]